MVTRRHFLQLGGASLLAWPPFQQAEPDSGTFYVGVIADTHIIDELYRGPEGSPEDTASIFRTADRLVEAREALNALRPALDLVFLVGDYFSRLSVGRHRFLFSKHDAHRSREGIDRCIQRARYVGFGNHDYGVPTVSRELETLRRAYAAGRFGGMGEIATQLAGVAPNDPRLEPYFALAEERDLPVLIHTLGIGPYLPGFRSAMGSPLLLEEVLVRHPKLRLFVENTGYPYRDEMIAMMTRYPQLHGDVSTISWVFPR